MNSKETLFHPTGNFPSIEDEANLRYRFLDKSNPVLKKIRTRLEKLGFKGKRNLPLNLLAFYYGVYFYNQISHHSLFPENGNPPIKLIRNPRSAIYLGVIYDRIYYNLGSVEVKSELNLHSQEEVEILWDPSVTLPSYVSQIIDGLEEANHLHLEHLHQLHKPNHNQRTDHRSQEKLWQNSDYDSVAYHAKLWHEFAALIVQRSYLNYYISSEYPDAVSEFNLHYEQVAIKRQKWIRRRKRF